MSCCARLNRIIKEMEATAALFCQAATLVLAIVSSGSASLCEYQRVNPSSQNDGYIMSPNYPGLYSARSCYTWIYYGRPEMEMSIRLLDVDIPSNTDICSDDYLMIGPINQRTYCGSIDQKAFELYEAQLTSLQYWVYVVFNSTGVGTKGRGFKLYYQLSNPVDRPTTDTSTNSTTTAAPSTAQSWMQLYDHITDCHFVFTAGAGLISTNSTVLNCLERTGRATWVVFSPGPDRTSVNYELHFEQCYLPTPNSLKIYDGYTNKDRIISYTNNPCSSYLVSSHHGFFVEYEKHAMEVFPSFKIQFVIVRTTHTALTEAPKYRMTTPQSPPFRFSDKCIFQLTDQSGEINSDGLVNLYQNTGYCSWLLYMPGTDGHQVIYTLNFERFQFSQTSILKVFDGTNMTAPVIGAYSSVVPPFSLTSSQNSIFVYYSPERNLQSSETSDVFTVKYNAYVRCALGYEPCGYGEFSCFREENRCDGVWHCPLHGGDERGCVAECPTDFSCDFRSSNCYTENDRCNGKGTCSNYMDEMGCTDNRCSSDKGLYLCRNGRCIYEKWRCDRMNDCFDNSDEEDCAVLSSPRVIVAAVIGSLLCALLLVVAVGCVCKVYYMRAHPLHGGPRHETPLSRQLAEMFYHRAAPPPYHEAMLTSRPYDEAYLELLGQTENRSEASGVSNEQNAHISPPRETPQRNSHQSNRRCRFNPWHRNQDQHQPSRFRSEADRLVVSEALPVVVEVSGDGVHRQGSSSAGPTSSTVPPFYSDAAIVAGSCCSDSEEDGSSGNETWCAGIENAGYAGDDDSHGSMDAEPVIRLEVIPSVTPRRPVDLTSVAPGLCLRSSDEVRTGLERNFDDLQLEDDDKDAENTNTSLSSGDSPRLVIKDDSSISTPSLSIVDNDSDSDCILDGNNAEDTGDDTDSDTACILSHA